MRNAGLIMLRRLNIAILMLFTINTTSYAQAVVKSVCNYIDGYWGEWNQPAYQLNIQGNYDNFIIYDSFYHPSNYMVKIIINNFRYNIDKKEKKRRRKENLFYEYSGIIEFYLLTNESPSTTKQWVYNWNSRNFIPQKDDNIFPSKKIEYPAIIKIEPYKDLPTTYNIFFDGYGIAFSI